MGNKSQKTGFRKTFMKVVNICAAVVLFGSMIYHVVSGDDGHKLSDTEMYVLLGLIGLNFAAYGAARALPGSTEYCPPDQLHLDSTVKSAGIPPHALGATPPQEPQK